MEEKLDYYNVFISHIHEDDAGLSDFKDFLRSKGILFRDSSITSDKPNNATNEQYIKSFLAERIRRSGTLIVYISPQTKAKYSKWVDWEIEYAAKLGKRIVGVWERGAKDCEIPDALDLLADSVVAWNSKNIIAAINGDFNRFETQEGTLCPPRQIKRHEC